MLKRILCHAFGPTTPKRSRAEQRSRTERLRSFRPSMDVLEDRRLLSVSPIPESSAYIATPLNAWAEVVGRRIFYNNSRYDGYNPALNATDDTAIATNKVALLPNQTATFANYTSSSAGINGIMIDIAGLAGTPTLEDFVFRVGNDNAPINWANAPTPVGFSVRPGNGVGGSTRITITWADGSIRNLWLQVTVRATATTGLSQADFFYFGNAVGDTGDSPINALSSTSDQVAVRNNLRNVDNPVSVTSVYDFNRDGLVDTSDEEISRTAYVGGSQMLKLITPPTFSWSSVVDRQIFYNNSTFDGNDPAADATDDAAIATDKLALLPGQTATFANYTSYSRGINGVMIDFAGVTGILSLNDFEFRVGNANATTGWVTAPTPNSLTQRTVSTGSTRVTLVWPDGAIAGKWLQVTVKANANTLLSRPDVFYFGNMIGEIGNSPTDAKVSSFDYLATSQLVVTNGVPLTSVYDFNRDGSITTQDTSISASNVSKPALELIKPTTVAPSSILAPGVPAFVDLVKVDIVNRGLFYNNSQRDLLNPFVTADDDTAIATDKAALLPGQTSSITNYSSYSAGINGIFVDIIGAPYALTATDFEFRVGKSADPSTWTLAPAPLQILVRKGAGTGGSDRVMIVWQDNVIQNTWLRITVKATPNSGLAKDDVFYFGNLIGDSGYNTGVYVVNSLDQIMTRNQGYNFLEGAPITHLADFNRDTLVNWADEWASGRNQGATLPKFVAPAAPVTLEPELPASSFFHYGDSGVFIAFGPALVKANDGTLLYFAEARDGDGDSTAYGIVLKRSFDNGTTWTPLSVIYQHQLYAVRNATAVVDKVTGEIFLFCIEASVNSDYGGSPLVMSSKDNGATWSPPTDITNSVKVTSAGNPNPAVFPDTPWGWYTVGPGNGIQLERGPYAGRLLISGNHRLTEDKSGPSWSHVIYSDDHGLTWHLGGGLSQTSINNNTNENVLVELNDGTVYMNIRVVKDSPYRAYSRSYDGGLTWSDRLYSTQLLTSSVHASILRVNENTLVFAAPDSNNDGRQRMTIWISHNNAVTWVKSKAVFYGYGSYSSMVLAGDDTVLLVFNSARTDMNSVRYVSLVRVNLRWLESADVPQFTWQFAEKAPGERAEIDNTALLDDSKWDNRAMAMASSVYTAPQYVEGPNGRTALRLTESSDVVMLNPERTMSLELGTLDSMTLELTMRTTDSNGVIIGNRASYYGWSLKVVNGRIEYTTKDRFKSATIVSNVAINDNQWHSIVAIRSGIARELKLIIDGVDIVTGTDITTQSLEETSPIMLGAYNDGTEQLAFDIDVLRVTRKVLSESEFMPANLPEPPRYPAPSFAANAPNSLSGLQLWLPSYYPTIYFADTKFADYLPQSPTIGAVAQGIYDVSSNKFRVTANASDRGILYNNDDQVGSSWKYVPDSAGDSHAMIVNASTGSSAKNFDFVQNTGNFTISTFMKIDRYTGTSMALFDNINANPSMNGFSLSVQADGSLQMLVAGAPGTVRFNELTPAGTMLPNVWYHVAVVGNGPGQPVAFYVTPVSAAAINAYQSSSITGGNGTYPTSSNQPLTIGGRLNGTAAFAGSMIDQAIYNRALSAAEIQQLFNYTKKS